MARLLEIENGIDPPKQVILRNVILQAEVVEKPPLIRRLQTHHRPALPINSTGDNESRFATDHNSEFINGIDP